MTLPTFIIIAICAVVMIICSISICRKEEKRMMDEYIKSHKAEYEKTKETFNRLLNSNKISEDNNDNT